MLKRLFCALIIAGSAGVAAAEAASPEYMMAKCRARAHELLRTRLPNIEVKYEGQRTDGTHAVNGSAHIGNLHEDFQCSFNRRGTRIVNFTVAHVGKDDADAETRPVNVARGNLNCAAYESQPFMSCSFQVARQGGGTATVRVLYNDGMQRTLHFRRGKIVSTDIDAEVYQEKRGDLNTVYVGSSERYELPDAILFGG
jgi:hypothetical protein